MTLHRIATLILILLALLPQAKGTTRIDSLMDELSTTIAQRGAFEQRKEDLLHQLRERLSNTDDAEVRFLVMNDLFDEYRPYDTDSALLYCDRREALARKMNCHDRIVNAMLNKTNVMAQTGMYAEAMETLHKMNRSDIPDALTQYYYYVVNNLYNNMADYTINGHDRELYRRISNLYKDSIVDVSQPGSIQYVTNLADLYNSQHQYAKSVDLLENYLDTAQYTTHDRAKLRYALAYAYRQKGDEEKYKENLIQSAIADQQACVREYVSLRELAMLLYKEGDIHHAHDFLDIAMADAQKGHARLRQIELDQIFPIVNDAYLKEINRQHRTLTILAIVIAFVTLLLIVAIYFVYRQMRKASDAHAKAKEANAKLGELNEELRTFNRRLTEANKSIAENSKIKEEYIAQFMDQCSLSIEKLDAYRKSLDKLMRAGKTEELRASLKSTDLHDEELKTFYRNFDATFLKLFPTFVDDFNKLLLPEEKIELRHEGQLTTELRIFALIRLGISDSVKIAQFLRYSVTTIYNYRTKTRNKAAGDRNKLEEEVCKIGLASLDEG